MSSLFIVLLVSGIKKAVHRKRTAVGKIGILPGLEKEWSLTLMVRMRFRFIVNELFEEEHKSCNSDDAYTHHW